MFWADSHVASVNINTLLGKEETTLKELLDEEDILQECKSSNKQLTEFLVRPNVTYELLQLIVEEPPENIDFNQRYKYSSIASEIISSRVACLSNNIANEPRFMAKLYSFVDGTPPLNPLLASYFAKVIEVLFIHNTGQDDWYTYQFRCLQVVEFFKSCPDFLPKFLNHLGTSGVLNSLEYITQFIDNDISNNVLTWLDSQQLVEKLIALICGTYMPVIYVFDTPSDSSVEIKEQPSENSQPNQPSSDSSTAPNADNTQDPAAAPLDQKDTSESSLAASEEKSDISKHSDANTEPVEKSEQFSDASADKPEEPQVTVQEKTPEITLKSKNETSPSNSSYSKPLEGNSEETTTPSPVKDAGLDGEGKILKYGLPNGPVAVHKLCEMPTLSEEKYVERLVNSRSANASQLLCSFISRGRDNVGQKTHNPLYAKSISKEAITHLMQSMFSAPPESKSIALINGIQVLLVMLNDKTGVIQAPEILPEELNRIAEAIIPFIPHFIDVMKNPPEHLKIANGVQKKAVGNVRLSVAHFFMVLVDTLSESLALSLINHDVFNLLLDMFFEYDFNNFLHSSVENIVCKALQAFIATDMSVFQDHFFVHCRLLERLSEAWDKSDANASPRPGYMGHVIQMVRVINECNVCNSLVGPQADTWQLLKDKLLGALANQNMVLATMHDDTLEDNMDPLVMTMQVMEDLELSNEFDDDSKNLFTTMCNIRSGGGMDSWTINMLNSSTWPTTYEIVYDDSEDLATIPSITDASSSPWNGVNSQDDMQGGWADFGNFQETAGLSTVPNTFTCEAFAASHQDDSSEFASESDKFGDDFADLRTPSEDNSSIQRLEQIQADTTNTSTLVIDVPSSENVMNVQQETHSVDDPCEKSSLKESEDVTKLSDSLSNVLIDDKPILDNPTDCTGGGSTSKTVDPIPESDVKSSAANTGTLKDESNTPPPSDAQR